MRKKHSPQALVTPKSESTKQGTAASVTAPRPWRIDGRPGSWYIIDADGEAVSAVREDGASLLWPDLPTARLIVASVNLASVASANRALPEGIGSQTSGDAREQLVIECSRLIDNGLAPLVAAGIIKPTFAAILASSLRVGVGESCGEPIGNKVLLQRTLKATQMLGKPVDVTDEIGGA